jgi:1,2-phenylacetyl-CoA epoxidase PaaB subunit
VSLLFDVIADLLEGIAVTPVFAADKEQALKAAKELFPGHRVTVVLKEGEPGS